MSYVIPKHPSPVAKAILHYFDQMRVLNLEAIAKIFTDDFVQETRPLSLGMPSRTKEEDLEYLQGLADSLGGRALEVTIYGIIDSEPLKQGSAHILIHGEPMEGNPFSIECIYEFTFTASLKVKALTEFVDSNAYGAMSWGDLSRSITGRRQSK